MKKILIIFNLLVSSSLSIAQCITDESIQSTGVYPEILPNGTVNENYNSSVTISLYPDTVLFNTTFPKDSIVFIGVDNLPNGMNYSCETQNCTSIAGIGIGLIKYCIGFNGIPTSEYLNDTITINYLEYLEVFSIPMVLQCSTKVKLKVLNNLGILEEKNKLISVYPNPVLTEFYISTISKNEIESLTIFSSTGRIMNTYLKDYFNFNLGIPLSGPSGVYFVEVRLSSNEIIRKRLIKL